MPFESALERYREGAFTDCDIANCIGLSARGYRELIKLKAVRTVTVGRGPGRVRICDSTVFKRLAVIAALNAAGQNLAVSGQIAFFAPLHTLLYRVCDPLAILDRQLARFGADRELAPPTEQRFLAWFDPDIPARAELDSDWLIDIIDNRFVSLRYMATDDPNIFGDLRDEQAHFVCWYPRRERVRPHGPIVELEQSLLAHAVDAYVAWEQPTKWAREFAHLGYSVERHNQDDDPLCMAAEAAIRSPVVQTSVNISLAMRKALRRYLELEPALTDLREPAASYR